MYNKFKLKKKLVSIALALALAAQPLASFPMNVFAGTDKNKLMTAPRIQKKTVTVPIPTTFNVPFSVTLTYTVASDSLTITGTANDTAPFPITFPVKLGDTVISSPGNVTFLFSDSDPATASPPPSP